MHYTVEKVKKLGRNIEFLKVSVSILSCQPGCISISIDYILQVLTSSSITFHYIVIKIFSFKTQKFPPQAYKEYLSFGSGIKTILVMSFLNFLLFFTKLMAFSFLPKNVHFFLKKCNFVFVS